MPDPSLLRRYDAWLLSLDGGLLAGDMAAPMAVEAVATLREAGVRIAFLTNDSRRSVEGQVRRLWSLGFQASVREVVTAGAALQHLLAERGGGSAYVVGSAALVEHVAIAGMRIANNSAFATRADVVVVGAHDDLHYRELRIATQAVVRGARLIAATRDRTVAMPDGPWPGTGAILAAIETATGREADDVVGLPGPAMYRTALDRLGATTALAVGDRPDVDVAGAHAFGIAAALLTGTVPDAPPPGTADGARAAEHVAASLAELVLGAE